MMGRKNRVGAIGERIASAHLRKIGYRIIETNFHTPLGELDLVAKFKGIIVFVEVRTRSTCSFGPPYLSVTKVKQRQIIKNALFYLKKNRLEGVNWRIDIVSVKLNYAGELETIEVFENSVEDPYI